LLLQKQAATVIGIATAARIGRQTCLSAVVWDFGHGVRTDSVLHRWRICTNITKTDRVSEY